jgi:hypothetical protein
MSPPPSRPVPRQTAFALRIIGYSSSFRRHARPTPSWVFRHGKATGYCAVASI